MPDKGKTEISTSPPLALKAMAAGAFFFGLMLRFRLVLSDAKKIVGYTSDDFYYYLNIAKNINAGLGVTFDGEVPTNGFHPLYVLLLQPIFLVFDDPILRIKGALFLLAAVDLFTAFLIYRIFCLVQRPSAGLIAGSLWMVSPLAIFMVSTGMESALQACALAGCCAAFLLVQGKGESISRRLLFGFALGLAFLARTDSIWFVLTFLVVQAMLDMRKLRGLPLLRKLFIIPGFALLVVAPFLFWNLVRFGSIVQGSLGAHLARQPYFSGGHSRHFLAELIGRIGNFANNAGPILVVALLAITLIGAGFYFASRKEKQSPTQPAIAVCIVLGIGVSLWFGFYAWKHLDVHLHYFAAPLLSATLIFGVLLSCLYSALQRAGNVYVPAVILAVILGCGFGEGLYLDTTRLSRGPFFWQSSMLEAAQQIDDQLPGNSRIASFNSGILGYFSNRYILNIDGVVNPEVVPLFAEKTIDAYLQKKNVNYIVDHALWIGVYQEAFGIKLAEKFDLIFQVPSPAFKNIICMKRKEAQESLGSAPLQ